MAHHEIFSRIWVIVDFINRFLQKAEFDIERHYQVRERDPPRAVLVQEVLGVPLSLDRLKRGLSMALYQTFNSVEQSEDAGLRWLGQIELASIPPEVLEPDLLIIRDYLVDKLSRIFDHRVANNDINDAKAEVLLLSQVRVDHRLECRLERQRIVGFEQLRRSLTRPFDLLEQFSYQLLVDTIAIFIFKHQGQTFPQGGLQALSCLHLVLEEVVPLAVRYHVQRFLLLNEGVPQQGAFRK